MFLAKPLLPSIRKYLLLAHHLNQVLPSRQSYQFRFQLQLIKRCLPLPQSPQLEFLLLTCINLSQHLKSMKVNNEIHVSTADQIYQLDTTTYNASNCVNIISVSKPINPLIGVTIVHKLLNTYSSARKQLHKIASLKRSLQWPLIKQNQEPDTRHLTSKDIMFHLMIQVRQLIPLPFLILGLIPPMLKIDYY